MSERNPNDRPIIDDLLTSREAVALLPGVSYAQLMRWAREGSVSSVQYMPRGPRWFRRSDIEALLEPVIGGRAPDSGAAVLPGLGETGR